MARNLDTHTLANASKHYLEEYGRVSQRTATRFTGGRGYVLQELCNFTFKDEFEFILGYLRRHMEQSLAQDLNREVSEFEPRSNDHFEEVLRSKLAIDPNGLHVAGVRGTTEIGRRIVGKKVIELPRYSRRRWADRLLMKGGTVTDRLLFRAKRLEEMRYIVRNEYWPIFAGEIEERRAGSDVVDDLPPGAKTFPGEIGSTVLALNPRISNAVAIKACDIIVDELDIGTAAANIRGRTGAQPATVDDVETGTLLFTLIMSDPAFGAAADINPHARATAAAITSDASADATGTLGYCRCAATGTGADDVMDGEAGTTGADFNFNTVSIVAGATVSMTSFTVTMPEL